MGLGRVWKSILNLGSHPFFKNVCLTYGPSKCPKMLPIPSCIHVLLFLTFLELLCIPHSCFCSFLHFSHGWEVVWLIFSGLDLTWMNFYCFLLHTVGKFRFLVLHSQWENRSTSWGIEGAVFSHVKPIERFWKSNFSPRVVFPHLQICFWLPSHFSSILELVFCCVCILCFGMN